MKVKGVCAFVCFLQFISPHSCENDYTKVAVGWGDSDGYFGPDDIEVIDLSSSNTKCQNLQNLTHEHNVGGLGFGENPIVCGGYDNRSSCHSLQNGSWKTDSSFNEGRYYPAMTRSPFPNDGSKLFVTGGVDDLKKSLKSSEVLTENGWQLSTPLPVEIYEHCMVMINSTSVMVIGGEQGKSDETSETSRRTFLLDGVTKVWSEGPELKLKRRYHSCAMIRKDSQSQDKSVIVVGGRYWNSTEVLDVGSSEWKSGPELPFEIYDAAMVEEPSGGVVLIGGFGSGRGYLDTLFRLPHAGSDATWEKMPQRLKTARQWHTTFLIPDEIANCN